MKKILIIIALMFSAVAAPAYAGDNPIYTSWRNNVAVGGYDVVSFFSGVPLEGDETFAYEYKDVEWQFSTQANLDLFKTNPDAFIPQYGGYCAWAVAKNKLAKGSPKNWHVEDGKLYLNFNKRIQRRWERRAPALIQTANANWPGLLED